MRQSRAKQVVISNAANFSSTAQRFDRKFTTQKAKCGIHYHNIETNNTLGEKGRELERSSLKI
jgi:hypothetical protein